MKSILHIISSPRKEASASIRLGKAIVQKLQQKYPESTLSEVNLTEQKIPHLDGKHLKAFLTPTAELSNADLQSLRFSDEAIKMIFNADFMVIGAPMYNFSIHSSLKAWIDQITRAGVTFRYTENGPQGLVKGKKVYLAAASGGVYSKGDSQVKDFVVPYLKGILGALGMTDITVYRAEGLSIPDLAAARLKKATDSIEL